MDIHSKLPFCLEFKMGRTSEIVTNFYQNEDSIPNNSYVTLKENVQIDVLFNSEANDAKFFFEGLESIPERYVEEEDGEPYLPPSINPITIFNKDSYPLIPGSYLIRVECSGVRYYSLVKVIPTRVTEEQWEVMKEEVEAQLTGLAQDLIKSRLGLVDNTLKMLAPRQISQFLVLQKHYVKALAAITDLYTKANYRIKKNYEMVPIERAKRVDERSFIHRLRYPENQTQIKSPINKFEYDLPENRWTKKIVEYVINNLKEFNILVSGYADSISYEIESELRYYAEFQENTKNVLIEKEKVLKKLKEYLSITQKMQNAFQVLQSTRWYQDVNEYKQCPLPHVMQLDARYRVLYQLYREMKLDTPKLGIDPTYALQWKRTDKLYEIWGFIQLINLVKELNFNPIEGWIYNKEFTNNRSLIPSLKPGTVICFKKNNLTLKLIYDSEIPYQRQDTNLENKPIYISGNNNRPDARLDVYDELTYIGSLIIDFKYRNKKSVWDIQTVNTNLKNKTMSQLLIYGSSCKSVHLYGENKGFTHINPIQEVWAAYPIQHETSKPIEKYEDHHLKLIKLSPRHNNDKLLMALDDVINQILNRKKG
jgi:Domain of unknown function (DUF2357)/PD-(D/E)XK nuclease superfamily